MNFLFLCLDILLHIALGDTDGVLREVNVEGREKL